MKRLIFVFLMLCSVIGISQIIPDSLSFAKVFSKTVDDITGGKKYCWINRIIIGDINNDGKQDGIVQYSCSSMDGGNASTGSGIAVYINYKGKFKFISSDDKFNDIVPFKISDGIIFCDKFNYSPNDYRCCPSIKTSIQLEFKNNKLIILK